MKILIKKEIWRCTWILRESFPQKGSGLEYKWNRNHWNGWDFLGQEPNEKIVIAQKISGGNPTFQRRTDSEESGQVMHLTSLFHSCLAVVEMNMGFPGGASGKEPTCQCRRHKRLRFDLWVRKIPWRRAWQPTPVFLPGKFHGQRNLMGYSPWGRKESDTTEHAHTKRKALYRAQT